MCKIMLLLRAMRAFRNWPVMVSIYLGNYAADTAVLETKKGVKIKVRTRSTDIHVVAEIFLLNEYPLHNIPSGSTIIDIGAHIGLFSVYAHSLGKDFRIFCFEPMKENFELLKENISANGYTDIVAVNTGLAGSTGKRTIYVHSDMAAHSLVKKSNSGIMIDTVTLKDVFDSYRVEKCDYLKMDCEGAEYEILSALPDKYFDRIFAIKIEYEIVDNNRSPLEALQSRLAALNFSVVVSPKSHKQGFLVAMKS